MTNLKPLLPEQNSVTIIIQSIMQLPLKVARSVINPEEAAASTADGVEEARLKAKCKNHERTAHDKRRAQRETNLKVESQF